MSNTHEIAEKSASAVIGGKLSRVFVEPTSDSEGQDAHQITIVLKAADVSGDEAVDLILKIRDALEASGDSQTPIINFATEDELATDADSEL